MKQKIQNIRRIAMIGAATAAVAYPAHKAHAQPALLNESAFGSIFDGSASDAARRSVDFSALMDEIKKNTERISSDLSPEIARSTDCFCTAEYKPVCGTNNITYTNACIAACAKATIAKQGRCAVDQDPKPSDDSKVNKIMSSRDDKTDITNSYYRLSLLGVSDDKAVFTLTSRSANEQNETKFSLRVGESRTFTSTRYANDGGVKEKTFRINLIGVSQENDTASVEVAEVKSFGQLLPRP